MKVLHEKAHENEHFEIVNSESFVQDEGHEAFASVPPNCRPVSIVGPQLPDELRLMRVVLVDVLAAFDKLDFAARWVIHLGEKVFE